MTSALSREHLGCIERYARERCSAHDAAHDALHLRRVIANARSIADAEDRTRTTVRRDVLDAACWLHDLVQLPKGSGQPGESARMSAASAREFLTGMSVCAEVIDRITHAIEAHSFSGGRSPDTIEAAILQDADRLDALGAIGIARLWITAAELGSALYDAGDPLGVDRALDDRSYGLDHIERKLVMLPSTMNTVAGSAEAERRARYVVDYRSAFLRELGYAASTRSEPD